MNAPFSTRVVRDLPTSRSTKIQVSVVDYPAQSVASVRVFTLGRGPGEQSTYFPTAAGLSVQLKTLPALREALSEVEEILRAEAPRPLHPDDDPGFTHDDRPNGQRNNV